MVFARYQTIHNILSKYAATADVGVSAAALADHCPGAESSALGFIDPRP
jgi:hypothetical protein